MFADLHMHSTFSDGTDTPIELCRLAQRSGIAVISLTDHDTVDGVAHLEDHHPQKPVKLIRGVEISCMRNRKLLHILGYYIDIRSEKLKAFLARMAAEKTENTRINFENALANKVFEYPWERVVELNKEQPRLSGVHVVKAMQEDRYAIPGMGLWDMFRQYFLPGDNQYIETETATGYDAIDVIKAIGGVPIIAHPKSIADDEAVVDLLSYGAQGLEVFHPTHTADETQKYMNLANRRNSYITGGSDWHGKNSGAKATHIGVTGLPHADYGILKLGGFA